MLKWGTTTYKGRISQFSKRTEKSAHLSQKNVTDISEDNGMAIIETIKGHALGITLKMIRNKCKE